MFGTEFAAHKLWICPAKQFWLAQNKCAVNSNDNCVVRQTGCSLHCQLHAGWLEGLCDMLILLCCVPTQLCCIIQETCYKHVLTEKVISLFSCFKTNLHSRRQFFLLLLLSLFFLHGEGRNLKDAHEGRKEEGAPAAETIVFHLCPQ